MGIFEIISAIVLIIACVFIVIVVLMKDTKTQMSQTISGSSSDSFYQKNAGRTKEAMLNKATIIAAVVFFVLALAVNVINVYFGGSSDVTSSSGESSVVVESEANDADDIEAPVEESTPAEESAPAEEPTSSESVADSTVSE